MTDSLKERLRDSANNASPSAGEIVKALDAWDYDHKTCGKLIEAAASLIERQADSLKAADATILLQASKIERQAAEIGKLREAVKAIAVDGATGPSCVATAHAVLSDTGKSKE